MSGRGEWRGDGQTVYLFEPLPSLSWKLVTLATLLSEVFHQSGEDRLELLQSGGHLGCWAGDIGTSERFLACDIDALWALSYNGILHITFSQPKEA